MQPIILQTKLYIPQVRANLVTRRRLLAKLNGGLQHRLIMLTAPAGSGKTTLAVDWIQQNQLDAAWLSLDEGDNDLARFLSYLVSSLQMVCPQMTPVEVMEGMSTASAEAVMSALINALEAQRGRDPSQKSPFFLFLDDYHFIESQAVHGALEFLLEHLPPGLHLVIMSRTDPPLPVGRLRVRGQITELRANDLRFTREEASTFLNDLMGLNLSEGQIAALEVRTEGWVAGLQLAAMAMEGRKDVDGFVRAFTGSHRIILDYLVDEVFYRQPEDIRNFLLRTSILDQMTAPLCDALTGEANGQAMLEILERKNLFIVPLDDRRCWFRYHQMFTDLLRYHLEQTLAREIPALHRKAALWYAANDQVYEAVGHALAARDYELAADLVEKTYPVLPMRGEVNTLLGWLDAIPPQIARSKPNLMLMYAWANLFKTEMSAIEPHLKDVLNALGIDNTSETVWPEKFSGSEQALLAQAYALRAYLAAYQGHAERAIQLGQFALERLPEKEVVGRVAVQAALGDAYRDTGDFEKAIRMYSAAIRIAEDSIYPVAGYVIRMDLARLLMKMGKLQEAGRQCQDVLDWGGRQSQITYPVAQAYILMGDLLHEKNQLEQALQFTGEGLRQCQAGGYQLFQVNGHITLARIHYSLGDMREARSNLEKAVSVAAESGTEKVVVYAGCQQARFQALAGFGGLTQALAWGRGCGLLTQESVQVSREEEYLALARVWTAQYRQNRGAHELEKACGWLDDLLEAACRALRYGSAIEILITKALAKQAQGDEEEALRVLETALECAEPKGYQRVFMDEGAHLAALLRALVRRGVQTEFAQRLLVGMGEKADSENAGGNEEFTGRELEVLRLMALGMSNQEIVDELVVSMSTIKTHITHIFSKLGASHRAEAIAKARQLRLL